MEVNGLPPERLSEPIEAAAFYVVSESLANVAKYASASQARVDLARDDGVLVVEVSDDGVGGADAEEARASRLVRPGEALGGPCACRASAAGARRCGPSCRYGAPLLVLLEQPGARRRAEPDRETDEEAEDRNGPATTSA